MGRTLTLLSPAKLNLFLHINGRRPDGYHELQTYFQLLDWGDTMHFSVYDSPNIALHPTLPGVADQDNLIVRAATKLQQYCGTHFGAHIEINKRIPMGGGLGGGSSNAASTLVALNTLWQTGLSTDELANIGRSLGADVPVFVRAHSAFAEGIGEKLTSMFFKQFWYLVLVPECHISTAEIFSAQQLTRDTPKMTIAPASEGQANKPEQDWLSAGFRNDCEALVSDLYPPVKEALDWLKAHVKHGQARLTGTGACCFTWLDSQQEAQQVLKQADSVYRGFIAKGVYLSPALERLDEAQQFAKN